MGTSINRRGPKPTTPLVPDWLDEQESLPEDFPAGPPAPLPQPEGDDEKSPDEEDETGEDQNAEKQQIGNRFNVSQRGFSRVVKTGDYSQLKRVLKNYVSVASGGPKTAARRLSRSGLAVSRFGQLLTDINRDGLGETLARLDLAQYSNGSAIEVLSALMSQVCGTSALLDDAVTRQAYAETVTRIIDETPNLDLRQLSEAQVCEMMAIFLEESIVYRLICDVGRSQTVDTADVTRAIEIEEQLYQIVKGLIHSTIVPELTRSMQNLATLNQAIQRIYQIAFRSIISS
ncbi:hypothetical protein GCM10023187_53930 [Nibrella viscosa]|uniref:Uncharacterized protein n=1 Tax=Nibrella viscosa TaxID=1084524 RepID=A0ABP8L152_9BACT